MGRNRSAGDGKLRLYRAGKITTTAGREGVQGRLRSTPVSLQAAQEEGSDARRKRRRIVRRTGCTPQRPAPRALSLHPSWAGKQASGLQTRPQAFGDRRRTSFTSRIAERRERRMKAGCEVLQPRISGGSGSEKAWSARAEGCGRILRGCFARRFFQNP